MSGSLALRASLGTGSVDWTWAPVSNGFMPVRFPICSKLHPMNFFMMRRCYNMFSYATGYSWRFPKILGRKIQTWFFSMPCRSAWRTAFSATMYKRLAFLRLVEEPKPLTQTGINIINPYCTNGFLTWPQSCCTGLFVYIIGRSVAPVQYIPPQPLLLWRQSLEPFRGPGCNMLDAMLMKHQKSTHWKKETKLSEIGYTFGIFRGQCSLPEF